MNMQQYTEEQIIALLRSDSQQENDQGLKELYRFFFPMIAHLIKNNGGNIEDVEDVFQDGIIVLFNQIKQGHLKLTCKLKTYFYSICRNLWLKKLNQRKFKTLDLEDFEAFIPIEEGTLKSIELNEEKEAMLQLLQRLGENCKQLLLYFYYERLDMKEIANRLNFANDQVARNKKVKCLKQLSAIVDKAPFFKKFFN